MRKATTWTPTVMQKIEEDQCGRSVLLSQQQHSRVEVRVETDAALSVVAAAD